LNHEAAKNAKPLMHDCINGGLVFEALYASVKKMIGAWARCSGNIICRVSRRAPHDFAMNFSSSSTPRAALRGEEKKFHVSKKSLTIFFPSLTLPRKKGGTSAMAAKKAAKKSTTKKSSAKKTTKKKSK
jgi:hypothetical protein